MNDVKNSGFTMIELIFIVAIIAIVVALAIPALLSSQRASNERSAAASLKSIATAQVIFLSNDLDSNLVRDYWTGDLAGLYCLTSAAIPGFDDEPMALIEMSLATADSAPLAEGDAGGEYAAISRFGTQAPKAGYWIAVLDGDNAASDDYQRITGGTPAMGPVHNRNRFGYITFPDALGVSGGKAAIINEAAIIYRREIPVSFKPSSATPPGPVTSPEYKDWPTDAQLKSDWTKTD